MQSPDRDEDVAWKAATTIMLVATLFTVVTRLLELDPFTLVFDIFIVYLPTAVIVGGIMLQRMKRWSSEIGSATTGDSTVEYKAA